MRNSNHIVITDSQYKTALLDIVKATHPKLSEARILGIARVSAMTYNERRAEVKRLNLVMPNINNRGCA